MQQHILMKMTLVINVRKTVDPESVPKQLEQVFQRKDPVSIEFNPLRANRNREITGAIRLQHPVYIVKTVKISVKFDAITVPSQTEMFQSMQAGDRIAIVDELLTDASHEIDASELNIGDVRRQRSDVKYFDLPE